jgi:prepilin-type N-terminal cleavage/methylation domain-containing protein
MKLKDNSGFTLIELLAVITIMGVLMMIAIPAINGIIQNVRKNVYVSDAKSFKSEVQKAIMEQTWARVNDPSATYYIHIKNVILPEGLEYIGASCFTVCSLEGTIVIPPNVTYIGSNAFQKKYILGFV